MPDLGRFLRGILAYLATRRRRPDPPAELPGGPLLLLRFGRHEMQTCVLAPSRSRVCRAAWHAAN